MPNNDNADCENLSFSELMEKYLTPDARNRLKPFWIDRAAIDVSNPTYQPFIHLEHKPTGSKKVKVEGDLLEFDKQYPEPALLADKLNLDLAHVQVQKVPFSFWGLYSVYSLASYCEREIASVMACRLWFGSKVLQEFEAGNIVGAQYGFQEIETDYAVYLGGCSNPDNPWQFQADTESRDDYLTATALTHTLALALDVDLYQKILKPVFNERQSLKFLHYCRSKSCFASPEMKQDSRKWLNAHREG